MPVAPVIGRSTSTTRLGSRSALVSGFSTWDAQRIPSRSMVPAVNGPAVTATALAVRPVEPVDLRAGSPGQILTRRLGEQGEAGLLEAVGEVDAGRALGDQGAMPRPAAPRHLPARRVERQHGRRKSPTTHARSASRSATRCMKLSGASAARAVSQRVSSSSLAIRPSRSPPDTGRRSGDPRSGTCLSRGGSSPGRSP